MRTFAPTLFLGFAPTLFLGFALGLAATVAAQSPPDDARRLADERALIATADALDHAVDMGDWAGATALFAPSVRVDLTGFGAPAVTEMAGADLVGGWARNRGSVKTAFHLRGNHLVRIAGDRATMTSHGYAWNRMPGWGVAEGGDLAEVWGFYEHRFARTQGGWRIDGFAFRPAHVRGNAAVFAHIPN
jgi:hypothetical protein